MTRPLIAAALLAAVIIGGISLGVLRPHRHRTRLVKDLVVAVAIYWSAVGVLSVIAWHVLRWPK